MKNFYAIFIVSIILVVAGFFIPPLGVIDGSVVTAVGELLMFAVVAQVPTIVEAARNGRNIKIQKGDSSIEVRSEADVNQGG